MQRQSGEGVPWEVQRSQTERDAARGGDEEERADPLFERDAALVRRLELILQRPSATVHESVKGNETATGRREARERQQGNGDARSAAGLGSRRSRRRLPSERPEARLRASREEAVWEEM